MNKTILKTLSFVIFHTQDLNPFITLSKYHYTVQPGMSGSTDTTRSTVLDLGQIYT